MSDAKLRSSVIRLAHAKPELRGVLLPLLKKAASLVVIYRNPKTSEQDWSGETLADALKERPSKAAEIIQNGITLAVARGKHWELTTAGKKLAHAKLELKQAGGPDLDLNTSPSQSEVNRAWPGISLDGVGLFNPYMKVTDQIEKQLRSLAEDKDYGRDGQEAYLGYSSSTGRFVSGYDWWYSEGGLLTGYAVLEFGGGRFSIKSAGFIETGLYQGGGLEELKSKFRLDLDLRLD